MAIDQNPPPTTADPMAVPAIDNEFPTYRAISARAIGSLILGLGSIFCFADLWFLVVAAGSVVLGLLAIRAIRRLPDVLTGQAFARVGIGLALAFALSALTRTGVQDVLANVDAGRFAKEYTEVLKSQPISVAVWYLENPLTRKEKKPDAVLEEMKNAKSPGGGTAFLERASTIQTIKDRLKGPGEEIRYAGIESKDINGLTLYANALVELDGPGSKEFPEKEQFGLVQMVKYPEGWLIKGVIFPYRPKSTKAAPDKPAGDHGHAH